MGINAITLWLLYSLENSWFSLMMAIISKGSTIDFDSICVANYITKLAPEKQENCLKVMLDKLNALDNKGRESQTFFNLMMIMRELNTKSEVFVKSPCRE